MADLRCKPGDRAMVWRNSIPAQCYCSAIGHVVKVERSSEVAVPQVWGGWVIGTLLLGVGWTYGPRPILCTHGKPIHALLDRDLVPLPPEDDVADQDAVQDIGTTGERERAAA